MKKRTQVILVTLVTLFVTLVSIVVYRNSTTHLTTRAQEEIMPYITYKPNQKQTTFARISPVIPSGLPPTTNPVNVTTIPTAPAPTRIQVTPDSQAEEPVSDEATPQPTPGRASPTESAQPLPGDRRTGTIPTPVPGTSRYQHPDITAMCPQSYPVLFGFCTDVNGKTLQIMRNMEFNPTRYFTFDPRTRISVMLTKREYDVLRLTYPPERCNYACAQYDKPVLYLYPEAPSYITVQLVVPGKVIKSIPEYGNGWKNVLAYPDGTLFYKGKKYTDLFYETQVAINASTRNEGFLLQKESLKADLSPVLLAYGLQGREYTEFLDYWVPRLQKEQGPAFFMRILTWEEKNKVDLVLVSPKPDTFIYFLAEFYSVPESYQFQQQQLPAHIPERKGFTVVEWGGSVQ